MKKYIIYIVTAFLATGCGKQAVEKAVWLNPADTLCIQGLQLRFSTEKKEWKAVLYSGVQPLVLQTSFNNHLLTLTASEDAAVIEGAAQICLENDSQFFYYPLYLKNKPGMQQLYKEFRSPKTLNPDSSLRQQRIVYNRDVQGNLLAVPGKPAYFFEEDKILPPLVAVERAVKDDALSAFYVQPGSCKAVPLRVTYRREEKNFYVTAGPLKDQHGNTVADGTMVSFCYSNGSGTARMESTLLNGMASVCIPAAENEGSRLVAVVNNIISQPVQLKGL
jgi:hypothetical protein